MLKTNSKKVKKTIKTYIIDQFKIWSDDNIKYDDDLKNVDLNNYELACNKIIEKFYKEGVKGIKYPRSSTLQDRFYDWCSGMIYIINTDYFLNTAVDLLGEWLEETEEEKTRYTESQAQKMITNLLYREIMNHATNTNILY